MIITEWAEQDRPREKMMANGAASLTEAELLAILINTGQKGKTAVDLARDLLQHCNGSLVTLSHTMLHGSDEDRLTLLKGIGPAKMCHIQAALELGRRRQQEEEREALRDFRITTPKQLFSLFNSHLSGLDHEELWAVYCSRNGKILYKCRISEGGVSYSGADIKKICRPAIEYMATYVGLCHNHPSSDPKPSVPDHEVTFRVQTALKLLDVTLLDHIIIACNRYYSFKEDGKL